MKKSFIVFISVLLIVLQTASAFAYSDLNVGSSGLKMSSSNSGRYQNVTVKNKGVLNLNGWGLEVYGDMKVEKGSKVKNGVIIFISKKRKSGRAAALRKCSRPLRRNRGWTCSHLEELGDQRFIPDAGV